MASPPSTLPGGSTGSDPERAGSARARRLAHTAHVRAAQGIWPSSGPDRARSAARAPCALINQRSGKRIIRSEGHITSTRISAKSTCTRISRDGYNECMAQRVKRQVQQEIRWANAAGDLRGRKREAKNRRGKKRIGRPKKPNAGVSHAERPQL